MSQSKTRRDSAIIFDELSTLIRQESNSLDPYLQSIQSLSSSTTSTMNETFLYSTQSQRRSVIQNGRDTRMKSYHRETDGYIWCSTQPVAKAGIVSKLTPQSSIPKTTHTKFSNKPVEGSIDLTHRMSDYTTIT